MKEIKKQERRGGKEEKKCGFPIKYTQARVLRISFPNFKTIKISYRKMHNNFTYCILLLLRRKNNFKNI